ncbi:hypothetical protein K3495_g7842 [Podosphaera aphanis]|nr:hypothetical protein K3495_g7842 [Podosphaera aphanis]
MLSPSYEENTTASECDQRVLPESNQLSPVSRRHVPKLPRVYLGERPGRCITAPSNPDDALINHLYNSLRRTIVAQIQNRAMLRQSIPKDLNSYLVEVRHINAVLRSANPNYTKNKPSVSNYYSLALFLPAPTTLPATQPDGDLMDLNVANLSHMITWNANDAANHRIPRNEVEKCVKRAFCFENKLCSWCYDPGPRARICAEELWNQNKSNSRSGNEVFTKSDTSTLSDVKSSCINGKVTSQILSLSTPDSDHLLLSCNIASNRASFQVFVFLDCGATNEFYNFNSAQRQGLPVSQLTQPRQLFLVDGRRAARITHTTTLNLKILGYEETLTFFPTNLGKYELVLGLKWLRKHNPSIN